MECEFLQKPMISYRSLLYSTTVLYDIYAYIMYMLKNNTCGVKEVRGQEESVTKSYDIT